MNTVAIIILLILAADAVINAAADGLNLKHLSTEVPPPFSDLYDPERYRASQEYLRADTRLDWIASGTQLAVLLAFWFAGGFARLDGWVRALGWGPVATGLVYIGVLALAHTLLNQPFAIYATFVIEERFGFNRTTWKTYLGDRIKGLGLAIVLGVPLLAGILAFFEYTGDRAWLWCWGAVTLYMLVIQFVAPTWIMPLFNRFAPLEEGELKAAILAYARSIGFPLQNVYVMDGSRRSDKSNAFFTGFGRNTRIVLFDTLIARHTTEELVAVLAHEMGHYKKKHILQQIVDGTVQMGIMFFLLSWFVSYPGLFEAFYVDTPSVYAGLVFFGVLYAPIDGVLGLLTRMRSRRNEYAADRFAVETCRRPAAMVSALKKLSVHNLSNLRPHPFYVFLNYSHPPVLQRIAAIERADSSHAAV